MVIDKSERWWRGSEPADLHEYLVAFTADGYPADEIRDCVCRGCGGRTFGLCAGRHEDVVLDVRRDRHGPRRAQRNAARGASA